MNKKLNYLFLILLSFLFSSTIFSQELNFIPVADTLFMGGGCTEPKIIACINSNISNSVDTLIITPGWNTWFWIKDSTGFDKYYSDIRMIIDDSLGIHRYQLWHSGGQPEYPIATLIPFDSSFSIYEHTFNLKFFVYDSLTGATLNEKSQMCISEIGIGIEEDNYNKSKKLYNYNLYPNFPNPFNSTTTINFRLPKNEFVKISVFDIYGRQKEILIAENRGIGTGSIQWNADQYASGTYFIKMEVAGLQIVRKCLLIK